VVYYPDGEKKTIRLSVSGLENSEDPSYGETPTGQTGIRNKALQLWGVRDPVYFASRDVLDIHK